VWSRGRKTPVRLVTRSRIVLCAAKGMENKEIAKEVGTDRLTVARWRNRFKKLRLVGIEKDAPRGGRPMTAGGDIVRMIVDRTTQTKPSNSTHWSVRTLADELKISKSMVHRVWRANGLKPHLTKHFKLSNDKRFIEKMRDIVGLYMNPPEHALVLCADEKTQIQALDRTQPGLPLKKGRCGTMTHDYKRNGTTTLFAAIDMAKGHLIGTCMPRHRHQEWIRFLKLIDKETLKGLDLHIIADNYATHKHPKVQLWLSKHPRFHMHFIPTSSSWLNLIERWFGGITGKRIRRGTFRNVPDLVDAILDFIAEHNNNPEPYIWTASVEKILAKIERAKATLDKISLA
jgi:transposase